MTIEFEEETFKQIEESIGKIRAAAIRGRMSSGQDAREELKSIVTEANGLTNLLLNGLADTGEPVRA